VALIPYHVPAKGAKFAGAFLYILGDEQREVQQFLAKGNLIRSAAR